MNSANEGTKPSEDFNINDDESQSSRKRQENLEAIPSGRKSPALSIVSTASSGSPLIRTSSTASKGESGLGPLKRPAPTSIAAAQLQQQQQQQQLQHGQTPLKKHSAKLQSGNKLAHMAKMAAISSQTAQFEQQATDLDRRLKGPASSKAQVQCDKLKRKFDEGSGSGGGGGGCEDQGKSFGYKFGKSLAFRANRFNQFWSVNKMRYMNLACLLMTLVCLCTILLFSKSKLGGTNRSELSPAQQHQRLGLASPLVSSAAAAAANHKSRLGSGSDLEADQELAQGSGLEFAIKHQPKAANDKDDQSETSETGGGGPDADEQVATARPLHSDGFNLFDERHDQNQAQDQDPELIQEARKQLKRQQETELEMEDESSGGGGGASGSRPTVLVSVQRSRPVPFLQDPINQVLQDLDGFGLFRSIRSRLAEQLKQQNLTSKAPTVIRSKNGATIIMSFTQQAGDQQQQHSALNGTAANETAPIGASSPVLDSMPSFLRDLLPPGVLEQGAGKRSPSGGFAAIALDSQPRATLSFRSSNLPFGGGGGSLFESSSSAGPFFSASPFELPPLFMPPPPLSSVHLLGGRPQTHSSASSPMQPPPGGLMSMLFRASRELAQQMRHQMEQAAAAAAAARDGANSTSSGGANSLNDTKQETTKQAQASQQQVKVIQLNGGAADQNNETRQQQSNSSAAEPEVGADEVETFSTASFIGLPSRQQQQQQQFGSGALPGSQSTIIHSTGGRSLAPRSMLMIESSSGVPSSLLTPDGAEQMQPASMLPPFPLMPSVFFMGPPGSGQSGAESSESRARMNHQLGPNPLLRSLIGSVVSDLTRSMALDGISNSGGGGGGEPTSRRPMSRSDEFIPGGQSGRDQLADNGNEWDEWSGESGDEPSPGGATSHEGPLVRSASSGSASSLFEHMFERLAGNRLRQQPQTSIISGGGATFKHTLRTPSGITIERIAGLPAGVQTVAPNVRSQSLSRMDPPATPMEVEMGAGRHSQQRSRANLVQEDEIDSSWRQLADEHHSSNNNHHHHHHQGEPTRRAMRARQSMLERMDSQQQQQQQQSSDFDENFPALLRVASARIRLLTPRLDSTVGPVAPLHFRLPAQAEQASDDSSSSSSGGDSASSRRPALGSSLFTSPNSPLFGFPALKSEFSSGNEQEDGERGSQQASGGQRRQRSFVYHSNHELAKPSSAAGRVVTSAAPHVASSPAHKQQLQPVESARSAPSQPQRQQAAAAAPLQPAAAVVMGRRLDDLVER